MRNYFSADESHHSHLYYDATVNTYVSCLPDTAVLGAQRSSSPWFSLLKTVSATGPATVFSGPPVCLEPSSSHRPSEALYHTGCRSLPFMVIPQTSVSVKLTASLLCRVVLLLHNTHHLPSQRFFTYPTIVGVGLSSDA